jgi:hypothetical protein
VVNNSPPNGEMFKRNCVKNILAALQDTHVALCWSQTSWQKHAS